MQCIQYHILAIVLLGQIPWHAEKQNVANHFGLRFEMLKCPKAAPGKHVQLKWFPAIYVMLQPEASDLQLPEYQTGQLANQQELIRRHVWGSHLHHWRNLIDCLYKAGWIMRFPPLHLRSNKPLENFEFQPCTFSFPGSKSVQTHKTQHIKCVYICKYTYKYKIYIYTHIHIYDKADYMTLQMPTYATFLFNTMNFIPYANLCQSLNLICTSTYQGLDTGRPDSYPAVSKKTLVFLDTLTCLLHPFSLKKYPLLFWIIFALLFFEKKISRILCWRFWIILFFCEKKKKKTSESLESFREDFLTKTIRKPLTKHHRLRRRTE